MEFFIHLRDLQHSSRVELLRQVSIISMAGLGFNLVWIRSELLEKKLQFLDLQVALWLGSCFAFLLAILGVLYALNLIPRIAQAQGDLHFRRMSANLRNLLSMREELLRKRLQFINRIINLSLIYAVSYTSIVLLFDFFPSILNL